MSSPRIAALVCEGQTDVPILRAVLEAVWPEIEEVRCLQPEIDEMDRARGKTGWSEVRAWCIAHANDINDLMNPDLGDPIDVLLVAIDLDIAIQAGIENPPKQLGNYETDRLRDTMTGWLTTSKRRKLPTGIILTTPTMAIEAWVLSALFPKLKAPEHLANPALTLVEKKKLRVSQFDGKPWKERHRYRDTFAPAVAAKLAHVRKVCPEADRTVRAIKKRRSQVES